MDFISEILKMFMPGEEQDNTQTTPPVSQFDPNNPMSFLPPLLQMFMGQPTGQVVEDQATPTVPHPSGVPETAKLYWPRILQAGQEKGVDPFRIAAHLWKESNFNPTAKNPGSSAGGIAQFIDSTARAVGLQDKFDPDQAIPAAATLLARNAEQAGGNWRRASQMYYGSPDAKLNAVYADDIERRIAKLKNMFPIR